MCSSSLCLRLEELQEKIVLQMAGEKVTPMVANPGRILLTSHRLYFQPFNDAEMVSVCVSVCVSLVALQSYSVDTYGPGAALQ